MNTHKLKTWPNYFEMMEKGIKTFEIRKNDRHYQTGDMLILKEYCPNTEQYTGQALAYEILSVISIKAVFSNVWNIDLPSEIEDFVIMSLVRKYPDLELLNLHEIM